MDSPSNTAPLSSENHGETARVRRLNPIKLKQLRERNAALEEEIPRLESSIAATESTLGHFVSADDSRRQSVLLDDLRAQLSERLSEWERLSAQLEEQDALS